MRLKLLVEDMREMQRNLSELLASDTAEEQAASLEIAQSASRFSRRARQVVDDKLTFSATLMRAGEVSAATRLLAEVEEEVRDEEIALIETVNEVKVAQAVRRGRITRLRLARSLAVAMLGACILAFSAVGMAVAGVFNESERNVALAPLKIDGNGGATSAESATSTSNLKLHRRLQIGDVNLLLTRSEFRRLTELTGGDVDQAGLTDVLGLLSGTLADKVEEAIAVANDVIETASVSIADADPVLKKAARAKKKTSDAPADEAPAAGDEDDTQPSPEPAEEPQPEPDPDPNPSPSPSEGDTKPEGNEEGGTVIGSDGPLGQI